ncbi:hypothetical protein A2966_03675 [Candidatus Roizmanbacteria bacterium RIFCSPLOWO2_01_FULL_41_22]|uniref:Type II secretion system protein GspF domain-containing protein n=2 Tax=Candidatus Roizmaniibacteriota TaxID=1752723 RepID=A0A1F7JQ56_9BACT|nr:MAG: hypothetical protein A2966_03675 [Candidatus Roizmanbacteria bacterium RIFCSPLOWO2_01_FULL_41_22]OGK57736.1 MAG: hypothetical protein A3H86_03410 [Candidatus Roizmanbacteria bacterium RIFCSPLOWO2_02_FULL_41_9]
MLFEYRALQKDVILKGEFEGPNANAIALYLKSQNLIPIEIKAKSQAFSRLFNNFFDHLTQNDITNFTRQLSLMLNAGLTLIDALSIIKKQTNKQSYTRLINEIIQQVSSGKNFSKTLEKHPKFFSPLYVALVRAGEASGKLDIILDKVSDNLDKQREFRGKVKNALIYPVIVIIAGISMIFILLTFVVPNLLTMVAQFNTELPLTTRILIGVSNFFASYWYIIIGLVIISSQGIKKFLKSPRGSIIVDTLLLKIPKVKDVIMMSNLVDATRTFSILIGSGVPILESLEITEHATSSRLFQNALKNVYRSVERGVSLGDAMASETIFPQTLIQMTIVGEHTGKLEETLGKIAHFYQLETESVMKGLITLIEPAILVVLGIAVSFIIFSIITPIFSLTNSIK